MKKKLFILALLVICLSIVAYGTLAYFTTEDTATNVITTGNIRIALHQWRLTEEGDREVFTSPIQVLPGVEVSKIVEVENTGGHPAWIRVSVDKAMELAEGITGEADLGLISFDINTEYWTELDGFYYYNAVLQPGEVTQPLFTQVNFADNMSNMYQSAQAIITVTAQGVQTIHNGETVLEAQGWPNAE